MSRKLLAVFLIIAVIAGVAGAVLSVVMVISAFQFSEWGRVLFYGVTMIICAEMAVLALLKLRSKESS